MKIMNVQSKVAFGRALSSNEKEEYKNVVNEAKNQLGIDKTKVGS